MKSCEPEKIFSLIPGFENASKEVARSIHNVVLEREELRQVADTLHGTWLGHPLHPALTDFVIGAWALGSVLDGISLSHRSRRIEKAADILIDLGNALSVPTAAAGLADFSAAPRSTLNTGATHALLNVGGLALNICSAACRRSRKRTAGIALSAAACGTLLLSAWLGGRLVFEQKVGVSKIPRPDRAKDWTPVVPESEIQDQSPKRVDAAGAPVLLFKSGAQTHAMGAVCAHEGGPLEEGHFNGPHVTCPWHQSVYDLRDGSVVHGPATYPEPAYDVRTQGGTIEVRKKEI
jgi:nitrite reductase/ring-hydroxylating ferredoxin subunit/uncharacterized membrane protein